VQHTHTSLLAHAMDVRPNSVPDTPFNLYSDVDSAVRGGRRPIDIAPDTNRESNMKRLITRPTLRLADARENLKDRLHSYIELRSVQKWNPPKHMAYVTFVDRLKSFATWPRRTELPTPESLAEVGFYYDGMYTLFYITFNTLFRHLSPTTIFTLFVTQGAQMKLRAFTAYGIGNRQIFPLKNMLDGYLLVST